MTQQIRIGLLTVSDRASHGEYEDLGGPAMKAWFDKALSSEWEAVSKIVPDEQDKVEKVLSQEAQLLRINRVVNTIE